MSAHCEEKQAERIHTYFPITVQDCDIVCAIPNIGKIFNQLRLQKSASEKKHLKGKTLALAFAAFPRFSPMKYNSM